MKTPRLLLACGDAVLFEDGETPTCPTHGTQRVVRVLGMPAPRIRGVATGPHVQTEDLSPWLGKV